MAKIANLIFNALFFSWMMLSILAIECKFIQIVALEDFIFKNLFVCSVSVLAMLAMAFIAARHLHRYFARLQERG